MSGEGYMNQTVVKKVKLEEKVTSLDVNCENLDVNCFKTLCKKLFTKQLDDKFLQAFNEFNAAGKIVYLLI